MGLLETEDYQQGKIRTRISKLTIKHEAWENGRNKPEGTYLLLFDNVRDSHGFLTQFLV
jgi:hypothetical protein